MLVAVLSRPYPSPPLLVGPFEDEDALAEWASKLRVTVGLGQVVDPSTFDGDRDRLWVYGTRYDIPRQEEQHDR
jgi:hypothetical protein